MDKDGGVGARTSPAAVSEIVTWTAGGCEGGGAGGEGGKGGEEGDARGGGAGGGRAGRGDVVLQ